MPEPLLSLPILSEPPHEATQWEGLSPFAMPPHPLNSALTSPEPELPQGDYQSETPAQLRRQLEVPITLRPVELLAPAGGPEAAFAAFHYGADAIYLGLKKFSARAEAENFTLDEVSEVTAYAHSQMPRRRVFVTVNTLIRQDELAELVETVAGLVEIGVDALIIQDLGVYHLVHRWFPGLELHASTQLAVHNRAGAKALQALGFTRVVLARELTFEEVHDITASSGIETEVFVHGALCYSYSGLCLFSSQTLGRSGNRGKCAYSCRDSFEVKGAPDSLRDGTAVKRDPAQGFPFSMKDLALPDQLPALRSAGVSCFKIEGRKKSPLYVATTTDYYRKLLDGRLAEEDRAGHEADLQTVFSRPWTQLFVQSHKDKEVADRDTVGHRGSAIGRVETVRRTSPNDARLRFRTNRALERHDGLQIDLPILGKPFGFAVDRLWVGLEGRKPRPQEVFEAEAGSLVEVILPSDAPAIPSGAPVYCSSSQAVKRAYRAPRPKPGLHHTQHAVSIELEVAPEQITATVQLPSPFAGEEMLQVRASMPGRFAAARENSSMETAARTAFEKLGDTRFQLRSFEFANPHSLFVPISRLNGLRRLVTEQMAQLLARHHESLVSRVCVQVKPRSSVESETKDFRWSLKVDRMEFLSALDRGDLEGVDEVVVDIARDHPSVLIERLHRLAAQIGKERIRIALPAITRKWEENGLLHKVERLKDDGWTKWEAANLSAWSYLALPMESRIHPDLDLATDWSVYVLNRLAALQLQDLGVSRFALSPEDGLANFRSLLTEFGSKAVVIVHQDTPLFLAESCAYANLIGGCPGKANCRFESMEMVSSHGEKVLALDYHCRTIVLNQGPFCLSTRLKELAAAGARSLRADFVYRPYDPVVVRDTWRNIRAGRPIPGGHAANFDRGVL